MSEVRFTGRVLGNYRLLDLRGRGGFGQVYLAQRFNAPDQLVAIKLVDLMIAPDAPTRLNIQARFKQEAAALERLKHPHIMPLLDSGEDGDLLYMALPFMPGGPLTQQIRDFPRGMPFEVIIHYLAQIADALDYAHQQGVVHRDIKPSNMLLDQRGNLFLADFGIARILQPLQTPGAPTSSPTTLTATGQIVGTPQYMAPEQVNGQKVGPAADIYALGVVLYQMVTGSLPFDGDTPFAIAMMQVQQDPPALRPQRGELPAAAERVILSALAKDPEERFLTAGALAAAFRDGLNAPANVLAPSIGAEPTPGSTTPTEVFPPRAPVFARGDTTNTAARGKWGTPDSPGQSKQVSKQGKNAPHAGLAIVIAVLILALVAAGGAGYFALQGNLISVLSSIGDTTITVLGPTATADPTAACRQGNFTQAKAATDVVGSNYDHVPASPNVPFPPHSLGYVSQPGGFDDGAYHFEIISVCTPDSTPDSIKTFFANAFPNAGWTQSHVYPYNGNLARACGDAYCWAWKAQGGNTSRWSSLEGVTQHGSSAIYNIRLANRKGT
jgi:serine/threonine protein kinase